MFENIVALLVFGLFVWFGITKIVEFYKFNKNLIKERDEGYIYDAKAVRCQKYLYNKFNIHLICDDCRWSVERSLFYMLDRDFLIPKDSSDINAWVDNLEIVCEVYKEVFTYYESEDYELLLKYQTGSKIINKLLLPHKIKEGVKRKCDVLGVKVY